MTAISAIILAGGRATRMHGQEKGLIQFNHKPMIQHVIERLSPQVDEIIINANREIAQYQGFNLPVYPDQQPDYIGPLAGFYIGLQYCQHDYLLTAPCDSPLLPHNLAANLLSALQTNHADIAVATSAANNHPVISLCKASVLDSLNKFIQQGGRKVSQWQKNHHYIEVEFDDDFAFSNINTPADLTRLASSD